jgi:hypothetical protein
MWVAVVLKRDMTSPAMAFFAALEVAVCAQAEAGQICISPVMLEGAGGNMSLQA